MHWFLVGSTLCTICLLVFCCWYTKLPIGVRILQANTRFQSTCSRIYLSRSSPSNEGCLQKLFALRTNAAVRLPEIDPRKPDLNLFQRLPFSVVVLDFYTTASLLGFIFVLISTVSMFDQRVNNNDFALFLNVCWHDGTSFEGQKCDS